MMTRKQLLFESVVARKKTAAAGILLSLFCCTGAAQAAPAVSADRVEIIQTPDRVVVGLKDLHLLRWKHNTLNAVYIFRDRAGAELHAHTVDCTDTAVPSHLLFDKREGAEYAEVTVLLRDGDTELLQQTLPMPATAEPATIVALSTETAAVVPGTRTDPSALPDPIPLPDLAQAREVTLADSPRRWDLEQSVKRVVSEMNFPSMGANNNSVIGPQTAYPDDPERRSHYDSVKSTLYDPVTGTRLSTLKYLVEIPLDPAWRLGEFDIHVTVPPERLGVHISDEKVNDEPDAIRITGNDQGGLMQGTRTVTLDDAGNMYFATREELIRFDVREARFEKAPVHIVEFVRSFLPDLSDVPQAEEGPVESMGLAGSTMKYQVFYGGRDRLFLSFHHSYFRDGHLALSAVLSVPTAHWDDAEAFKQASRLNAASWAAAEHPLYNTWVPPEGELRKLNWTWFIDDDIYMLAYDKNHFWRMRVDEQGNTVELEKLTELEGRPLDHFEPPKWAILDDGRQGVALEVRFGDDGSKAHAFRAAGSNRYVRIEEHNIKSSSWKSHRSRSGARIRAGTTVYGVRSYSKEAVAWFFDLPDFGQGTVTVYYDILEWMRQNPEGIEHLLEQMHGPSLGPEFGISPIPGEGMTMLGNSEYGGYYWSYYDLSKPDDPVVRKRNLSADVLSNVELPLGAGLGPYCRTWRRESDSDVFYFAGYTGIGRMRVRESRQLRMQSVVEPLAKQDESIDGAPLGYTKWFRDMIAGLNGKIYLTGVGSESRGATAYSGGLGYLDVEAPDTLKRLTGMSACHFSARLDARLVLKADAPASQEIFMPARFSITVGAERVPDNRMPKLFCYADRGDGGVQDRYGFSLVPDRADHAPLVDFGLARNRLYGIMLLADGTLASIDLDGPRFVDAIRFTNPLQSFDRNTEALNPAPDGTLLLCTSDRENRSVTFHAVDTDAAGRIVETPRLTCDLAGSGMFPNWKAGELDFLYDRINDDGSYDLVLTTRHPYEEAARLFIIPDVILP
jgi:hypothetical protein